MFDRVISSIHIATNILFKFDLGNESNYAQDYDLFLYLTQSRFVSIVAQFMIIIVVDGYDHYVILSVDYVNAQRLKSMAKFDECLFGNNRNSLSILAFD